jgi:Protein of unknown function (DUF3159)
VLSLIPAAAAAEESTIRPETRHDPDLDPPTGPVLRPGDPTEALATGAPERAPDDGPDEPDEPDHARDPAGDAPGRPAPTLLEQMGGVSGVVASGVPVVVFVTAQAIVGVLTASIVAAVAVALAISVWRLVRHEPVQPALSGLLGVAVCAFVAYRTGEAKGFFLLGIWTSLVYGGVFLVSVIVRRPLVGVIWHLVNSEGQGWRHDPHLRRAFDLASLAWVVVFGARFVVQRWLYDSVYADAWLGWVRLAMGIPLAAVAAAVTVWAIRRSRQASRATA